MRGALAGGASWWNPKCGICTVECQLRPTLTEVALEAGWGTLVAFDSSSVQGLRQSPFSA